jgi:hypothetical protein
MYRGELLSLLFISDFCGNFCCVQKWFPHDMQSTERTVQNKIIPGAQKMCEIKEKCVFTEQEKTAWLVSSMDEQNLSPGVGIIYHVPTQAPFITHHRSGWHPVWDFCFPQHRFWGFGSSRLIHWVAASLIHDVSKECTAFFDPWREKQYISFQTLGVSNSATQHNKFCQNFWSTAYVTVRFASHDFWRSQLFCW